MKRLLTFLLFAIPAWAQTPATVTGTVTDAGNNLATSGYVQFDVQPHSGSIQYYIPNVTTINPTTQCSINPSGQVQNFTLTGPCLVWGNDNISPGNTNYKVTFAPNGLVTSVVQNELIVGSSYNLNVPQFRPLIQLTPQQNTIITNPFQTNILPTANATFNIGSPTLQYGAIYASQLFLGGSLFSPINLATLTGNQTFTGLNIFSNSITLGGGGFLTGTFTGNPTFSGSVFFSGTPTFSNILINTVTDNCGVPPISGFIRVCSTHNVTWRNNANTSDCALSKNTSDQFVFGCAGMLFNVSNNTLSNTPNTAGHYLRNNGTQYVDNTIQSTDLPATTSNCTGNQFAQGLNAGGTPICITPTSNVVYSTPSSATTSAIGVTTMATAGGSGNTYRASAYVDITVGGSSCSGTNTFAFLITYTDPNASTTTTVGLFAASFVNNGVPGADFTFGTPSGPNGGVIRAKSGTTVQYSTTWTPAGGCSPSPTYQVYPVLEVLN